MQSQDSLPNFQHRESALRNLRRSLARDRKTRLLKEDLMRLIEVQSQGAYNGLFEVTKHLERQPQTYKELPGVALSILVFDHLFFAISDEAGNYIMNHWDDEFDLDINLNNFYDFILDSSAIGTFVNNLCKLMARDAHSSEPISSFFLLLAARDYLFKYLEDMEKEDKEDHWLYLYLYGIIEPLDNFIIAYRVKTSNEG